MIDFTPADMQTRLAQALEHTPKTPYLEFPALLTRTQEKPKPAAVLMPLLRQDSAWHILLTRRRDDLPEHSGQVAFPGGRADEGDATPEDTALRESREEIGLQPQDVVLLGRLQNYLTITNYLVTPVVGIIPWPYPLKLEAQEVSRAFTMKFLRASVKGKPRPRRGMRSTSCSKPGSNARSCS